jgi:hypothetical protein
LGWPSPDLMRDEICKGCLAAGKDRGTPQPLVVALHGDEGSPAKLMSLWSPLAERGICRRESGDVRLCEPRGAPGDQKNFWVFAPKCPATEGCAGSYWRWGADVGWLGKQVDAFKAAHAVDDARIYLAGWSGGATYIAMKSPDWFPRFIALSLAGGGTHPHKQDCFPATGGACAPVTFLMGSGNPLFSLAEQARRGFERCGHALDYQLLDGVDHAGEWRAYQSRVAKIAWWLLEHPEGCASRKTAPALDVAVVPSAIASASALPPLLEPANKSPSVPPTELPRDGCACQSPADPVSSPLASALLGLFSVLRFFRFFGVGRVERRLAEPRRSRP